MFSKKPDARQLVPRGSEQQGATAQSVCFRRLSKRNGELRYRRPLYSKYVMLQPRASKLNATMEGGKKSDKSCPLALSLIHISVYPQRQQKDIFIKTFSKRPSHPIHSKHNDVSAVISLKKDTKNHFQNNVHFAQDHFNFYHLKFGQYYLGV